MKILMFEPDVFYTGGGGNSPSIHLSELASHLQRDNDITVIARNPGGTEKPGENVRLIRGIDRPFLATITYAITGFLKAFGVLRRNRPDVIYARHHVLGTGVLLAQLWRIPVVSEMNGLLIDEAEACRSYGNVLQRIARWVEGIVLRRTNRIVAVSAGVKSGLIRTYGIPDEKITVVENGANTELFRPAPSDKEGTTPRPLRVGFSGSFNAWHGVEELVTSIAPVLEKIKNVEFVLLGDGPLKKHIVQLVTKLGLAHSVVFADRVRYEEAPQRVQSFDVCVILKQKHIPGSPLKLWEYMAAGKPVVASDTEDFTVLKECNAGMVVDPTEPEQVAHAIISLLENEPLREKMGRNGRRHVETHRSWRCVATEVEQVLRETVGTQ